MTDRIDPPANADAAPAAATTAATAETAARGEAAPATAIILEDSPAPGPHNPYGPGPGPGPYGSGGPYGPWGAYGPFGPPETEEQRLERIRRRRAALLRRGAAALVLLVAGTASAFAVTAPDRTDLPGLATPKDGRYTFPALTLPPLPSGRPAPSASGAELRHAADLRYLVLPAPKEALAPAPTGGASPSAAPSASSAAAAPSASASATSAPAAGPAPAEWAVCEDLAAELKTPAEMKARLLENACRAGVVREWTAKDGTRARIRLLGFGSREEASNVSNYLWSNAGLKDVEDLAVERDAKGLPTTIGVGAQLRHNGDPAAGKPDSTRVGYLLAGDVVGLIVMTNPAGVPVQAFHQVVLLQSDLLA